MIETVCECGDVLRSSGRGRPPKRCASCGRDARRALQRETHRQYRARDPEKCRARARKSWYWRRYGLTPEEYDALIARGCSVCGTTEGRICADHDHATGALRGPLCVPCNAGLGHFADDPARLRAAAAYLEASS